MTITKSTENAVLTLALEGRLDTNTAPELEKEVSTDLTADVQTLILDLKELEYISSAGLRVLLAAQKKMNKQGNMVIKNVNDMIMDVFQVTGFVDILTIEYVMTQKNVHLAVLGVSLAETEVFTECHNYAGLIAAFIPFLLLGLKTVK